MLLWKFERSVLLCQNIRVVSEVAYFFESRVTLDDTSYSYLYYNLHITIARLSAAAYHVSYE